MTSAIGIVVGGPAVEAAELDVKLVIEEVAVLDVELAMEEIAVLDIELVMGEVAKMDVELVTEEVADLGVKLVAVNVAAVGVEVFPDVVDAGVVDTSIDVAEVEYDWVCTKQVQALDSLFGRQVPGTYDGPKEVWMAVVYVLQKLRAAALFPERPRKQLSDRD